MQSSLEKLRKFFRLEHENGYNDTAIIGGLAKMLDYWEGEARADGITEEIIQAVLQRLQSYGKLTPESRAESLKGLWKRIGDQYPEATQKQTRPPRPQPRPRDQSQGRPVSSQKAVSPSVSGRRPHGADGQRAHGSPVPAPQVQANEGATPKYAESSPVGEPVKERPLPPGRAESAPGGRTSATPAASTPT